MANEVTVKITKYGNVDIGVNPGNGKFYANTRSGILESTSLAGIKKQIDERGGATFQPFDALRRTGYNAGNYAFQKVRIVGIKVKGNRKEWITATGHEIHDYLFEDNDNNPQVLKEEIEMEKRQSAERDAMSERNNTESVALTERYNRIFIVDYIDANKQ